MRRRFVSLVVAALTASACETNTGPERFLSVTTAAPSQLRTGQRGTVTVTVTNSGPSDVQLDQSNCDPPFVVSTRSGVEVAHPPVNCTLPALGPRTLRPGESFTLTRDWRATTADGRDLPAGQYVVRGFVRTEDLRRTVRGSAAELTVIPN